MGGLFGLTASTPWSLESSMPVAGDVGHPQGLSRRSDGMWLVSTAHVGAGRGELLVVDASGMVMDCRDVGDGDRFHPGGVNVSAGRCWVPVAEYRPNSSTRVVCVDDALAVVAEFRFDDHIGAMCELADGSLFAVSWASRRWWRLDVDGVVLDECVNVNHFVDIQDVSLGAAGQVVATGVRPTLTPDGVFQLGGVVVVDVDNMVAVLEVPVAAWMPSRRSVTFNGAHVDVGVSGVVSVTCLVDDGDADIAVWVSGQAAAR